MAISQEKFITISAKREGSNVVINGFRSLLVCSGEKNSGGEPIVGTYSSYDALNTAIGTKMSEASLQAAESFFKISLGRVSLSVAISASEANLTDVIAKVKDNWKLGFTADYVDTSNGNTIDKFKTAVTANGGIALCATFGKSVTESDTALATYKSDSSCVLFAGVKAGDVALIPAILSSTDYASSVERYCFATAGLEPLVNNDDDYEKLTGDNINFIGNVKNFGSSVSFLMMGVSADGTDLVSYFGEFWVEASIKDSVLNTFLAKNLNAQNGVASIKDCVLGVVAVGLRNGVIVPGKVFTDAEKDNIAYLSGSNDAADAVSSFGYWCDANISKEAGKYVVNYILVYGDATGVKKVVGVHDIV